MTGVQSQIVEVCIFRRAERCPEYLLLQRAVKDDLYPNIWQIMTGTINPGETAVHAALRELEEETKLLIHRFWIVPWVDTYYDPANDVVQTVPVFAAEIKEGSTVELSAEHQNCKWVDQSGTREHLVWPGQRKVIDVVHEYIAANTAAAQQLEVKDVTLGGIFL
jgi:8-oxo-dGTP pyrophosphatase MutT (NUDIX family)